MLYAGEYTIRAVWEVDPERLKEMMAANRLNQSQLADRVGLKQPSIGRLLSGEAKTSRHIGQIAAALNTTVEYLMGRTDDSSLVMFRGSWNDVDELGEGARDRKLAFHGQERQNDDVELDLVDFAYGMGGTFLDQGDMNVEKATFSRRWLRHFTDVPASQLGSATGVGDSMEPVIHDRDVVIFDRSARLDEHLSDKMWVFAFGQIGMIKRLRPLPDGSIKIISANRDVPEEIAVDSDIHIIGRVVCVCKRH